MKVILRANYLCCHKSLINSLFDYIIFSKHEVRVIDSVSTFFFILLHASLHDFIAFDRLDKPQSELDFVFFRFKEFQTLFFSQQQ